MIPNTYWNYKGTHQILVDQLQELIPTEGPVKNSTTKNKNLDRFRRATNCYYDLYNNGLCNRATQFAKVFGVSSSQHKDTQGWFTPRLYQLTETAMDRIILEAAKEQNLATA
jgi:hypothetical protein